MDTPRFPCAHCEEAQLRRQEAGLRLGETLYSAFAFRRSANHTFEQTVHRGIRWFINKFLYLSFVWSSFVLTADEGTHLERFATPLFILSAGVLGLFAELVDPGSKCLDQFDEFDGVYSVDRVDTRYLVLWHTLLSGAAVFGSKIFGHPWTGMHVYMGTLTVFIMLYHTRTSKHETHDDGSRFEAFVRMLCHIILGMVFSASLAIFLSFVHDGFFEGAIQEGLAIVAGNGTALLM
ncbi:hypothetical protein IWZ00DRAFT_210722 [Phyllosticta capitalensis]|uniref:Uncharacterized protein n=1 Tax=Phyllosticta capitalensis TaxID=121624 RepID=A0ABR1YSU3_9PEZI